jgi:hypothetical protein
MGVVVIRNLEVDTPSVGLRGGSAAKIQSEFVDRAKKTV